MKIALLTAPNNEVIAVEDQFGKTEGQFIRLPDGSVQYIHPSDLSPWPAGSSLAQFEAAAEAWNTYAHCVVGANEEDQLRCVSALRDALLKLGVGELGAHSYWAVLLEQAEQGLL